MKNRYTFQIIASLVLLAGAFVFGGSNVEAATINTVNSGCTLDDAIDSVNAGSNQGTCTAASGSYGTEDTINLHAGTTTLTADLPTITEPVSIIGAGMNQSGINGVSGQYRALSVQGDFLVTFRNFTITAFEDYAIRTLGNDVFAENINIDGTDFLNNGSSGGGLLLRNNTGNANTVTLSNIYVHDIIGSGSILQGISVSNHAGGASTDVSIENSTVARLGNEVGSVNAFLLNIGAEGINSGTGLITGDIKNVTVSNTSAAQGVAGFGGFAMAQGGNSTINMTVQNVTVVEAVGGTSPYSTTTAFFAAGAGLTPGHTGTTNLSVSNSLMASNLANNVPNNCDSMDLTSVFSGSGTGVGNITSLGHNISDDATCTDFTEEGDQQNVYNIISTLGTIQDNGGAVPTRALLAGSPALSAGGSVLGITTDARGVARPLSNPDVGAFESDLEPSDSNSGNGGAEDSDVDALANTGSVTLPTIMLGMSIVVAAIVGLKKTKLLS